MMGEFPSKPSAQHKCFIRQYKLSWLNSKPNLWVPFRVHFRTLLEFLESESLQGNVTDSPMTKETLDVGITSMVDGRDR
uniref:Uncharacterized protein n=1 Tax=Romanomermis culicivorax TaxID=13658 RepID=A0A915HKX4_ROMCU